MATYREGAVRLSDLIRTRTRRHAWVDEAAIAPVGPLGLLLGPRAPVRVVDGRIFEERGEDEDEAHDEIDVDGLDVRDARQRGAHARANCRHGEHGGDA